MPGTVQDRSISVVIPAYGHCPHLGACLDALAGQSFRPKEIIVYHTGSHDPSGEMSTRHPGVNIIHSDTRAFAGAARNLGARHATGDWLAFLDCDMIAAPDWLAKLAARISEGHTEALVGSIGCGPSGGAWGRAMWFLECGVVFPPVSYTHLTLPTICSV